MGVLFLGCVCFLSSFFGECVCCLLLDPLADSLHGFSGSTCCCRLVAGKARGRWSVGSIAGRHGVGGREASADVLLKDQECRGTERMMKPRVNLLCLLESMAYG